MMKLPVAPFSAYVKPAVRFQKSYEFLNFHLAESTSPILAPHNVEATGARPMIFEILQHRLARPCGLPS